MKIEARVFIGTLTCTKAFDGNGMLYRVGSKVEKTAFGRKANAKTALMKLSTMKN